jgi:folylpolyglutamate synthase/dihydropteroate synthase
LFADPIDNGNIETTIKQALSEVNESGKNTVIIYCGSFYVMEEARSMLGIADTKDPDGVNS